jgi:hypothetical protein
MSKFNWDEKAQLAWTDLTAEDFVQSRSSFLDVPLILEKLEENYSGGKVFMAVYNETPDSSAALIKSASLDDLKRIQELLGGVLTHGMLEIKLSTRDLKDAGELLSKRMKEMGI